MITRFFGDVAKLFDGFTADLFWTFATSAPVLLLIGLVAAASFAVAHLPRVVQWLPSVKAYVRAAAIVQVAAVALLLFLLGFRLADGRADMVRLRDALSFKQKLLDNMEQTAVDAERLRRTAVAEATAAREKLDDYCRKFGCDDDRKPAVVPDSKANATTKAKPAVRACAPPAGYVEWLRELQRRRPAAGREQRH